MVEDEDEDQKVKRLAEEEKDKAEAEAFLGDMDKSWEAKKTREQEQALKKRRMTEIEDDQKPKKRMRKMEYTLLQEDWGEAEDEVVEDELVLREDDQG